MKITFITELRFVTYNDYLSQTKPMIEWILKRKVYSNPELIKTFKKMSRPLIEKNENIILGVDENIILGVDENGEDL